MLALCATHIVGDVTILKQENRLVLEARAPWPVRCSLEQAPQVTGRQSGV
jgi:hypothetical protein